MRLPVHCCCRAQYLGSVETPETINRGAIINGAPGVVLEASELWHGGVVPALAFKSKDYTPEQLATIPGFRPAEQESKEERMDASHNGMISTDTHWAVGDFLGLKR